MRRYFFTLLALFFIAVASYANPDIAYIVIAVNGDVWLDEKPAKPGDTVFTESIFSINDNNSYLALLYDKGYAFELTKKGNYDPSEFLATYTPFIGKVIYPITTAITYRKRSSGAVPHGTPPPIQLPYDKTITILSGDRINIKWRVVDEKATIDTFDIRMYSLFDDSLMTLSTTEKFFYFKWSILPELEEDVMLIRICKHDTYACAETHAIRQKDPKDYQPDTTTAAGCFAYAWYLDNHFYEGEAIRTAYKNAAQKAPEVKVYKDFYYKYTVEKHLDNYTDHYRVQRGELRTNTGYYLKIVNNNPNAMVNGKVAVADQELKWYDNISLRSGTLEIKHFSGTVIVLDKPGDYTLLDILEKAESL